MANDNVEENTQDLQKENELNIVMTKIEHIDAWERACYFPLPALVKMLVAINVFVEIVVGFVVYSLAMVFLLWVLSGTIALPYSFVFGYIHACISSVWDGRSQLPVDMVTQITGNHEYYDAANTSSIKCALQFVISAFFAALYFLLIQYP